ncbi:LOW QUALITY PROTEIN: hypothetical protein MAR_018641 [Mya arenaria]|uniref:C2H2-type domain-containing protein n=1 Tax=Mya arenaria TaxID=6604 RepID=A0ABY7EF89_MYAAR|nr:LOW QUALITY PROTEIN: hypothetical protein MAR_018641 [Mya arenaria]
MQKHNNGNNQHCPECLKVFTRNDALDYHLRQEHGWTGGVKRPSDNQEGGGIRKRHKLEQDPSSLYEIEKVGEKKIENFKTTATYYKVFVKDLEIQGLQNILKTFCISGLHNGKGGKCQNCGKSCFGSFQHKPNLCVIHKNVRVFKSHDTTTEFCKWLFSEENEGATVICHTFKGYSILQLLHDNAVLPKVITTGSKNMSIDIPMCNVRMIDSLNFIPMALADRCLWGN